MTYPLTYWIHPSRPVELLRAMMRTLAGPSRISFEGSLNDRDFWGAWNTIPEGESPLKRQTISPRLDLIIMPLSQEVAASLSAYLGEHQTLLSDDIIHVQIERAGELAFGAYDNFHKECTVCSDAVSVAVLQALQASGVIIAFGALKSE